MKTAKRIIAVILLIALIPGTLVLCAAAMPKYYADSYYAELGDMYSRLRNTEGKRIIVLGGSSVAFGLEGETLENMLRAQGYSYSVVPFGLYAAVGTSAMVDLCMGEVRDGDIVVLAIEPTSETFSTYFGATAFLKCAESDASLIKKMTGSKRSALAGNLIDYFQAKAEIARTGILPDTTGAYAKSSFNSRCDMIYPREGNAMLLGYDTSAPVDLASVEVEEDFAEQISQLRKSAESAGGRVVMSFAPVNSLALEDSSPEAILSYFELLRVSLGLSMISNPNDYIMDSGWFYDNNFHLNSAGAKIRTYNLGMDILNYLGYYGEVEFQYPEMPESIALLPEDSAEGGYFTFESMERGGETVAYLASGLTEKAEGRTSLTLPSLYNGLPVVGYTEACFAGRTDIEEITLPATVETLTDNAFIGCTGLKRLVLGHSASIPMVTAASFAGTESLKVMVRRDAYPSFRDGAGCETNPWEDFLDMIVTY